MTRATIANPRSLLHLLFFLALPGFLTGCWWDAEQPPQFPEGAQQGYQPIYGTLNELTQIEAARTPKEVGKIYSYRHYLLINEVGEGIHLYNNSNPESPQPLGFLALAGNTEMSVVQDVLYVNHRADLVGLRITDQNDVQEVSRIQDVWSVDVPPERGYYFECVEPEKGQVIGWRFTTIENPKCYF
jgi:hypothetical protein